MAKSRKSTPVATGNILPELNPRDTDTKYTGGEPLFLAQPTDEQRKSALTQALGWYSRYFDRKVAKDAVLHFAAERGVSSADIKVLRSAHERHYNPSLCWVARLAGRGLELNQSELARIGDHLKEILAIKAVTQPVVAVEETVEIKAARPNVQEIMIARARECAGEIEGLFDAFLTDGSPDAASLNVVGLLTERGIMAQHVPLITEVWTKRKAEYEAVLAKSDPQLIEGYSQYGRVAMKSLVKWCEAVLSGLASYTTVKKVARAPRKKKPVSPEKMTAKVKYLKTFKDDAMKVDITGLHPSKLVGAQEAFLYDVEKRKVVYVIADSHAGSLSVKGTTILGFDATQSGIKTVRKPAELLKKLPGAGKPASRKMFSELATTHAQWQGRTNDNMIILKAW